MNQPSGDRRPARHSDPAPCRQMPPYKVILHRQPALELMFVVRTIMELTRLCREEATYKMWEAHHSGQSLLLVTHRERAELYVEQFGERGMPVTTEAN